MGQLIGRIKAKRPTDRCTGRKAPS